MQRTLQAIGEHAAAIRERAPQFRIIATSALRRADNEAQFDERVRALTGAGIEIISGEEEAACSFAGAVSGIPAGGGRLGVLDVGGGSSEYAVGTSSEPEQVVSCEIGAVRLTEAFPALSGGGELVQSSMLEEAASFARKSLQPALAFDAVEQLVLVGGSATTTVSLVRGAREFFAYAPLRQTEIQKWIHRLAETPLEERKALPGMNPQRADILLAGLVIIGEMVRECGCSTPLVSTNDVLLGYLLRHPL